MMIDTQFFTYGLWLVGCYLLASLSPGDLLCRARGVNIRNVGSGNPGTRNIYEQVGALTAVTVLLADLATGILAVLPLALAGAPDWMLLAATVTVMGGHIFPLFWGFDGGVGGAVVMGAAFGLLPLGALAATPMALATVIVTRRSIFAMWAFFAVTLGAGWAWHQDIVGIYGLFLAIALATARWVIAYRITGPEAIDAWMKDEAGTRPRHTG